MSIEKTFTPLFTSDSDWKNNAVLNWSHDPLELYTMGYKEAADILVLKIVEEGRSQDTLVYPICFLYRHYLELRLKGIIREGSILLGDGYVFPKHHDLSGLWHVTKKIVSQVWPDNEEQVELDVVEHAIAEYSKLDHYSSAFRYPIDKKDNDVLVGVNYINLKHLAEFMNDVAEALENISGAISVYRDLQQEFYSNI